MVEESPAILTGGPVIWPALASGIAFIGAGALPVVFMFGLVGSDALGFVLVLPALVVALGAGWAMRYFVLWGRRERYGLTPDALLVRRRGDSDWRCLIHVSQILRVEAGGEPRWDTIRNAAPLRVIDLEHHVLHLGPIRESELWVQEIVAAGSRSGAAIQGVVQPWVCRKVADSAPHRTKVSS